MTTQQQEIRKRQEDLHDNVIIMTHDDVIVRFQVTHDDENSADDDKHANRKRKRDNHFEEVPKSEIGSGYGSDDDEGGDLKEEEESSMDSEDRARALVLGKALVRRLAETDDVIIRHTWSK